MADTQKLLRALSQHTPLNQSEHTHLLNTIYVLESTKDPLNRKQFKPGHLTASVWIINPAHTHTLLLMHPHAKRWQMPGGHPDGNPDLLGVALRESEEETALGIKQVNILQGGKIFDIDVQYVAANPQKDEPEHLHFDVRYLFESKSSALPVSPENLELRWATYKEAQALFPADGGHYRCIEKLRLLGA